MSKEYVCDCCGTIMKNPYSARMKEFYVDADYDIVYGVLPVYKKTLQKFTSVRSVTKD